MRLIISVTYETGSSEKCKNTAEKLNLESFMMDHTWDVKMPFDQLQEEMLCKLIHTTSKWHSFGNSSLHT